jgi:putative endopeptidase
MGLFFAPTPSQPMSSNAGEPMISIPMIQRRLGTALLALSMLTLSTVAGAVPAIGSFGIDLDGRDLNIRPGDDFFQYAGGKWLSSAQMPPDKTSWGTFVQLRDTAQSHVREILEAAAANSNLANGSTEKKIGDFYASFLDTAAINAKGLAPAAAGLAAINKASNHTDMARLLARPDLGLPSPIDIGITLDEKNPDRYVVEISHGGLALPDRDFYLREDQQFKDIRAQYQAHVEKFLTLAGQPAAAESAQRIVALEIEIAKLHWPKADRRDRDKTYNAKTRQGLRALAPQYPWDAAMKAAELDSAKDVVVSEVTAIEPLARLFRKTPLAVWKRYATFHYLRTHSAVLPTALDDENFAFFGKTLSGQPEQRARWKRAVDATSGALGEGVGQYYVAKYFPPAAKTKMLELVENLRRAYAERIDAAPWMSAETKKAAAEKLATFRPKIGYPDKWRDYSTLAINRDDAFGNRTRASMFEWQREVARLHKPTDRDEWGMSPQTVNAYYNSVFNEIVFPAAILQPPFFDPEADPAVNYGGIGGVIGHEMGHGFDDQGAKSDAHGVLHAWWKDSDVAAFNALGDRLVAQYDSYEPLPNIKVNGRLTLGENIGDLGGLTVGYRAYLLSLGSNAAPVLDGISASQRFFLSWAQVWRTLYRDQSLRNQILSDPHSPAMFRVNGVVRNVDAWYEAFGVAPTDKLYLAPAERVHIW